jgi:acetyl esterase
MDYYLDPELAPLAAMIPPLDWSDVAGVREFTAQTYAQIPAYQSGQPLAVTDVTILAARTRRTFPGAYTPGPGAPRRFRG